MLSGIENSPGGSSPSGEFQNYRLAQRFPSSSTSYFFLIPEIQTALFKVKGFLIFDLTVALPSIKSEPDLLEEQAHSSRVHTPRGQDSLTGRWLAAPNRTQLVDGPDEVRSAA